MKENSKNTIKVKDVIAKLSSIPEDSEIKFVKDGVIIKEPEQCCAPYHISDPKVNNNISSMDDDITSDELLSFPLISPTKDRIDLEQDSLRYPLNEHFIEVREKNAIVAEILGEIHKREIAGLLEYVTQMQSQEAMATQIMCHMVNKDTECDCKCDKD